MVSSIHPAVERRARWLLRLLVLWGLAVVAKLFYIQIVRHDHYADLAEQQQTRLVEIPAHRGTIYDRNGHILAISVPVETVIVNPTQLPNVEVAAGLLSEILGLNKRELLATLTQKIQEKRGYYKVADQLKGETVFANIAAKLVSKKRKAGKADATISKMEWILRKVENDLGNKPITAITTQDIVKCLVKEEAAENEWASKIEKTHE